jgi:hypothetical protein
MPIDKKHIGKSYGPKRYEVGFEKLREFAYAIGGGVPSMGFTGTGAPQGLHPWLHDRDEGARSPFGSIIGLPNFAVVFAIAPFGDAVTDPALGINLLKLVHGEQTFEWFDVIKPGDVITSTGVIADAYDKAGMDFLIVNTESKNQTGKTIVKGVWTAVIKQG